MVGKPLGANAGGYEGEQGGMHLMSMRLPRNAFDWSDGDGRCFRGSGQDAGRTWLLWIWTMSSLLVLDTVGGFMRRLCEDSASRQRAVCESAVEVHTSAEGQSVRIESRDTNYSQCVESPPMCAFHAILFLRAPK